MFDMEFEVWVVINVDQVVLFYFDLGEVFYNMIYFGQVWNVVDFF